MATARAVIESVPVQGLPYVGLRPFEPHERDRFFGRERDAQILCDRILSSRLTILYALSGLGKSSLLRALVVPKLQESHSRVVYIDTWGHRDPLQALKKTVASLPSQPGLPNLDHDSLSLVEIVRLLSVGEDQSLVLVFDQFEEFLVRHAQNLDPLRSELAALVRTTKLDVAVVLTLREEFLASLEPFRQQILNLFQSAYRLESLSKEDLGKAIREPAKMFGGDCEKELTDALIKDLERGPAEIAAGPQLSLGLPMLQLVCQELWQRAPDRQLSLALYERLGRAQRVIDDYVRGLMPKERVRQNTTADLLKYLAPRSGLKMSYSVQDLAGITNLQPVAIEAELKPLEAARILRTREYSGGVRYELEHDAFIPVLRSWREEILERKRQRERKWRLARRASVVFMVVLAVGYALLLRHGRELALRDGELAHRQMLLDKAAARLRDEEQQARMNKVRLEKELSDERAIQEETAREELEHWQTGGLFKDLGNKPKDERERLSPSYFDMLVDYVLLHQTGEERLNQLRNTLRENENLVPLDYDNQTLNQELPAEAGWPLELHYSSSRSIAPTLFAEMWRNLATQAASDRGMPVPLKVHLVEDKSVPREHMQVVALGRGGSTSDSTINLDVPICSNQFLIVSSLASVQPGPVHDFLERFRDDWVPFPQRHDWLLVPRWSAPVWKAAGAHPITPSGIDAYLTIQGLLGKPEPLFSPDAMGALLQHARDSFPETVAEAQHARGSSLGADLADRVEKRYDALLALPQILDQLAEQREDYTQSERGSSSRPDRATQSNRRQTSNVLSGPWKRTGDSKVQESDPNYLATLGVGGSQRQLAFLEAESHLPEYRPVRVYVGRRLVPEWFPDRKDLSDRLATEVNKLRDELYHSYGVRVPGFRFTEPIAGDHLLPDAIRIEIQGDPRLLGPDQRISGPDTVKSLIVALRAADERNLDKWITAETTKEALGRLPPNTRKQLEGTYSLTDLKRLLRKNVKSGSPSAAPPVGGARYSTWLLSSLLFWALGDEKLNLDIMGKHLRETEKAGLKLRNEQLTTEVVPEVRKHLENGIKALIDDDVDTAEREFGEARKQDPNGPTEVFPLLWSERLPEMWLRDLKRAHQSLQTVVLSDAEQIELQDLSEGLDAQRYPGVWIELMLYRLASGEFENTEKESMTVADLLTRSGWPDELPPEQASWLAMRFLGQYDPVNAKTGNPRLLDSASALLESAVKRFPDQDRAHQTFMEVVDISRESATPNWSARLLNRLAEIRPGGVDQNLQLERAWELCGEERSDRLVRALQLVENYEKIVASSQLQPDDHQLAAENISYVRAKSYFGLVRQGQEQYRSDAERLLRTLLVSKQDGLAQEAYLDLVQMLYEGRKDEEAQRLNKEAQNRWPDAADFLGTEMLAQLENGSMNGVERLTRLAEQKASRTDIAHNEKPGWLFLAALGSLLTRSSNSVSVTRSFLATKHDYKDYVLMIGYAIAADPKSPFKKLLVDRWAEIKPSTWSERIRNGDASAWREMLIGRLMGAPESARLFDLIQQEEAWKNSEFSHLAEPLRGQRCEAWFYDAMSARANGSDKHMHESLRRSAETKYASYYEYGMAIFLLSQKQLAN